jgi:predicted ATPase
LVGFDFDAFGAGDVVFEAAKNGLKCFILFNLAQKNMIRLLEAKNFRSLRNISQELGDFHVLVGANASGKTTFLDSISFIADLVGHGIDQAVRLRTPNFKDLTFGGLGGDLEFAVELELTEPLKKQFEEDGFNRIRYEVIVGLTDLSGEHAIKFEQVILLNDQKTLKKEKNRTLFPQYFTETDNIRTNNVSKAGQSKLIIKKKEAGNDNFYPEKRKDRGGGWMPSFRLGIKKSALGNLPADESLFPCSSWLKEFLINGVQVFILDSLNIRKASPPGQSQKFKTDGSNLPWVVENLRFSHPDLFKNWISHVNTALPDIKNISTVVREDDRHRYLKISYHGGIDVPSWLISDGTLRLLALTLPAYLPDFDGAYLIEEPENGIHPKAMETIFQSLSSVYNAQILLASHSPVILSMVKSENVLCFAKLPEGITDIVKGSEHPMLKNWKGETNLSVLFAGGVLS